MKRYIKSSKNTARRLPLLKITASSGSLPIFTPENFAEMLSQLPQFSDYNIGLDYSPEGTPVFSIGDTDYNCVGV